jgi:hypothetical protein
MGKTRPGKIDILQRLIDFWSNLLTVEVTWKWMKWNGCKRQHIACCQEFKSAKLEIKEFQLSKVWNTWSHVASDSPHIVTLSHCHIFLPELSVLLSLDVCASGNSSLFTRCLGDWIDLSQNFVKLSPLFRNAWEHTWDWWDSRSCSEESHGNVQITILHRLHAVIWAFSWHLSLSLSSITDSLYSVQQNLFLITMIGSWCPRFALDWLKHDFWFSQDELWYQNDTQLSLILWLGLFFPHSLLFADWLEINPLQTRNGGPVWS